MATATSDLKTDCVRVVNDGDHSGPLGEVMHDMYTAPDGVEGNL